MRREMEGVKIKLEEDAPGAAIASAEELPASRSMPGEICLKKEEGVAAPEEPCIKTEPTNAVTGVKFAAGEWEDDDLVICA